MLTAQMPADAFILAMLGALTTAVAGLWRTVVRLHTAEVRCQQQLAELRAELRQHRRAVEPHLPTTPIVRAPLPPEPPLPD